MNAFKQLLGEEGAALPVGTWVMSASSLVAEAMGHAGFDFGVVDMEHTPLDLTTVVHMLQGIAGTRMVPIVRVPWNDAVTFKRVLDLGATTFLVPFVQNADEAARAVGAVRYPPDGWRGMAGMSRASRFGTAPDYLTTANTGISVILQLETLQAVEQLESIAAVPGVSALFMGPGDLSATMGLPGKLTHPSVMAVMADVARRCRAVGMPVGTVGGTPEVVAQYRAMGYNFLAIASDLGLMMRSATAALASVRQEAAQAAAAVPAGPQASGNPPGY
jgi:2-keto-3-deoxy-L-rhamnonate aldolase RhmA